MFTFIAGDPGVFVVSQLCPDYGVRRAGTTRDGLRAQGSTAVGSDSRSPDPADLPRGTGIEDLVIG